MDEAGQSVRWSGEMLATTLDGSGIRLVVLAACQTGTDSAQKRFSGIAHQLMKSSSLPAVVAMQFSIPDEAAIAFNRGFYSALAKAKPLEEAVTEGRKAIIEQDGSQGIEQMNWAAPVLFMRPGDTEISQDETENMMEKKGSAGTEIKVGNIHANSGTVNIAGRDIIQTINTSNQVDQTTLVFKKLYRAVEAHPQLDSNAKSDLKSDIQELEAAAKGTPPPDQSFLARKIRSIQRIAPDILELIGASFGGPGTVVMTAIKMIADRAQQNTTP